MFQQLNPSIRLILILVVIAGLVGCSEISPGPVEKQAAADLNPTSTAALQPQPASTPTEFPVEEEIPLPSLVIRVPGSDAPLPVLDGIISPGEWDQAAVSLFEDGSELLLMHADGFLYLAIRSNGPEMIVGNIYLQRGEKVSVMHSSAALGTAKFAWHDGAWMRTQNFTWRCRDIGFSDAAQAKRADFLQQEGWVAAISRMGTPNELEYKIGLTEEISALAVNILQELTPNPFPAGLADDCVQAFPGGIPEEMQFSIEDWVKLELAEN